MAKDKVEILFQVQKDVRALKAMQDNFNDLQKDVVKLDKGINKAFNLAGNVAKFIGVLAVARKAWQATTSLITRGIDFSATKEQSQVAFETLLGSADEASERIDQLIDFAAKTPFRLPGIIDANRQLQVLTDGTLAGKDGLRLVGDAAAATGRDMSQVAFWVGRTYAGLKSGTPVGEATLRLIEMGLVSGETALELQRLAKDARSSSQAMAIIEETFKKTSGAMEKQSQTLTGLKTTLSDTIDAMAAETSKPIFDTLKESIKGILVLLGALPDEVEKAVLKIEGLSEKLIGTAFTTIDANATEQELADLLADFDAQIEERQGQIDRVTTRRSGLDRQLKRDFSNSSIENFEELEIEKAAVAALRSEVEFLKASLNAISGETLFDAIPGVKEIKERIAQRKIEKAELDGLLSANSAQDRSLQGLGRADRIKELRASAGELPELERMLKILEEINAKRIEANKVAAENETELNKANTITREIQDNTDKINKDYDTALDTNTLQNGTLEEQRGILEGRVEESKAAQKAEADLLAIKVEEAKAEDNKRKIATAEANIETSKKKFLTEQLKLNTDLLKLDEKIAEERKTDIKDKFKVLVAEADLKLDNIRHEKDLLELDGLSIKERSAMNELVDEEKRLIQDVINLRQQEVAEVSKTDDKVRIAALEKEIQELKQKKATVRGGPTELEIQKEVNESNVEAINITIGKIQHQKELLELNGLEANERQGMLNLIAQESKAIEAIIELRKLELSLVAESTGDRGEIDRLQAIIAQLEQRLELNEASKGRVTPLTRGQQSFDDFTRREDPENTFESTSEAAVAALLDFQTQAGSFTNQFYDQLLNIQGTLTGSMSESIEGLITRTMSWGDALRNVGSAIGTTVVQGIANMAAQWITSQLSMFVLGKNLSNATAKLGIATATKLAAANAPAATASLIGSFGTSGSFATMLPALSLANQTAMLGLSTVQARQQGGIVRGGEQFVRMNERGEEFVINADVTKSFGMDFWNGVNQGRITPQNIQQTAPYSESSGGGASAPNVNVAVFSKIEDASSWLDSQEGEKKFIDTYQRLKDEIADN